MTQANNMLDTADVIDWSHVCFIDCETRSSPCLETDDPRWYDITKTSVDRYATKAYPIVITWAFGLDGAVKTWAASDVTRPPRLSELPQELFEWAHIGGFWAAWNSRFDRFMINAIFHGTPHRHLERWLDMMAHAAYNNLPLGLDRAAHACGLSGKVQAGKALIKLFCTADGETPQSRPDEWARFLDYAVTDVAQMQAVAEATFPVPRAVWEEFWVSEIINDRGLPFDRDMAVGGAKLADEYAEHLGDVLSSITDEAITKPKQFVRQRAWVWDRVMSNPFVAEHMIEAHRFNEKTQQDEYVLSMDRPRITKMIAALQTLDEKQGLTDDEWAVLQLLEEREWGASSAPMKFDKMLAMGVPGPEGLGGDRLPGQYVFAGATQTKRFSSRGVQVHNMTRSTVGNLAAEEDAALLLIDGADLGTFEASVGNAGKALSRLIRPTIAPIRGRTLVWGDWSNIEARGLPWLARAENRLDVFRAIDADPENTPDVYLQAAAGMYHHDPMDLLERNRAKDPEAKSLRQKGKIAELALGFNGGPGALQSMAANYGMSFDAAEAKDIVDRWRTANAWAVDYWAEVWDAFTKAVRHTDGRVYWAGRVAYQGIDMAGEIWVVAYLPDGHPLFYRNVKERVKNEYDPFEPDKVIESKLALSFEGEDGLKWLWPGVLVENVTQAACASILRATLTRIERSAPGYLVGHTHDEIILEGPDADVQRMRNLLHTEMLRDPGWYDGLPVGVDIGQGLWYSKTEE